MSDKNDRDVFARSPVMEPSCVPDHALPNPLERLLARRRAAVPDGEKFMARHDVAMGRA
jgi:hypothetical protein